MTKEQLATIRREMAAYKFDTSDYLQLSVLSFDNADKKKAAAKRKGAVSRKAKPKKK